MFRHNRAASAMRLTLLVLLLMLFGCSPNDTADTVDSDEQAARELAAKVNKVPAFVPSDEVCFATTGKQVPCK